jgi:hypothetical protein
MSQSRQSSIQGRGRVAAEEQLGRYDCREVFENMEFRAGDGDTAPYRCGSWECYCCGYRMRQNLVEEIERVCRDRPEMRRMMTLTLDPAKAPDDDDEKHRYLTERWNALRTELNDRYDGISYIWVREDGERSDDPHPHLHIIVDRYIPQEWLSRRFSALGGGEVVDIRYLDRVEKAAHYVGKYLTKEALSGLPDGIRRYGSSADLDLAVRGGDGDDDGRDWDLVIEDRTTTAVGTDEYLVRGVAPSDFVLQRRWGGPEPPPDRTPPPSAD